jgi:hypothetical protein
MDFCQCTLRFEKIMRSNIRSLLPNLVVAALALLAPRAVSAAVVEISTRIGATHDPITGVKIGDGLQADGLPKILRMDISVIATGLGPNESFGLVGFDFAISGIFTRYSGFGVIMNGLQNPKPNYVADAPTTSLSVGATGQPLTNYYTGGQNGDLGVSTSDLIGILTAVDAHSLGDLVDADDNPAPDPRLQIGKGNGTRIGVAWVNWNGQLGGSFGYNAALFATVDTVTHQFSSTAPAIAPAIFIVPEPSSLVLAGIAAGAFKVLWRHRRARELCAGRVAYAAT